MRIVNTEYSAKDGGHYSSGVVYKDTLYISGQLSINPETNEIPKGGVKAEAEQALKNLELVLKEENLTLEDVVMCRVYLPDVNYWGEFNDVYSSFFGDHKPARVVVPTRELFAGCLVEIEAVAAVR